MKPHHKWILATVLTITTLCVAAMLSLVIFGEKIATAVFPSRAQPAIRDLTQIQSILGVTLPPTTQIEFAESSYDNMLFESWIFKNSQPPFTLADVSSQTGYTPSTDSGRTDLEFIEKRLNRTLTPRQYGIGGRWDHQGWNITFQIIQADDGYYTRINAESTQYLTYQKPNGEQGVKHKP
jgi:hypothetical protein